MNIFVFEFTLNVIVYTEFLIIWKVDERLKDTEWFDYYAGY